MARVSAPISIDTADLKILENLIQYGEPKLSERAKIVVACLNEPSNKKVAASLDITEHTVAKWKEAYRSGGIAALQSEHGGGRKAKVIADGLEANVLQLLQKENHDWTIHALAQETGASDYQVSKVLQGHSIVLARKHSWTFPTQESCQSSNIEVLGLYLCPGSGFIIGGYHPYGIQSQAGIFETNNRVLATKIEHAEYALPLPDAIAETLYYHDNKATSEELDAILTTCLDNTQDFKDLVLNIFLWSQEPFHSSRIFPHNTQLTVAPDVETCMRKFLSWAGAHTDSIHHYVVENLVESIKEYQKNCSETTTPFRWSKRIISVGSESDPVQYALPESNITAYTVEEIEFMIKKELDGKGNKSGFFAYYQDGEKYYCRNIENKSPIPDADKFTFETEEGFLNFMNQLEKSILKARDEAGIEATQLILEGVKKNKNQSGL